MNPAGERVSLAAPMRIEDVTGDYAGRKFHDNIASNVNRELGYLSDNAYDGDFLFTVKQSNFKTLAVRESATRSADKSKGNR